MPSQGPNSTPNWISDLRGFETWSIPPNAELSDNIYTDVFLFGGGDFSDGLTGNTWNFAIPVSATINGFIVTVEVKADTALLAQDLGIFLIKPPATFSANRATISFISTVESVIVYGGAADLWGLAWTPADVNDPLFGVSYSVGDAGPGIVDVFVDQITVTVFFTLATGRVAWQIMGVGAPQ
jgi:hypothetical protein